MRCLGALPGQADATDPRRVRRGGIDPQELGPRFYWISSRRISRNRRCSHRTTCKRASIGLSTGAS